MKPDACENLQKEALTNLNSHRALAEWKAHAAHCEACAQRQKVLQSLDTLASQPIEGLDDVRMRAIRQALAARHRPKPAHWGLWSSLAFGALLLILAMVYLRPKDPFSLNAGPTKWQQIAANPDWELETNDRLRNRIQAMRQDFRLAKPQSPTTIPSATKSLKNRLERLRNRLETEE